MPPAPGPVRSNAAQKMYASITMANVAVAATAAAAPDTAPAPLKKPKITFMLHEPANMSSLGKYVSTDYRYAALKVASRGHKQILLRKTNSKEVREFAGDVVTLDTPKQISRGDRVISYNKKPTVKFVRKFVYTGALPEEDGEEEGGGGEAGAGDGKQGI